MVHAPIQLCEIRQFSAPPARHVSTNLHESVHDGRQHTRQRAMRLNPVHPAGLDEGMDNGGGVDIFLPSTLSTSLAMWCIVLAHLCVKSASP